MTPIWPPASFLYSPCGATIGPKKTTCNDITWRPSCPPWRPEISGLHAITCDSLPELGVVTPNWHGVMTSPVNKRSDATRNVDNARLRCGVLRRWKSGVLRKKQNDGMMMLSVGEGGATPHTASKSTPLHLEFKTTPRKNRRHEWPHPHIGRMGWPETWTNYGNENRVLPTVIFVFYVCILSDG